MELNGIDLGKSASLSRLQPVILSSKLQLILLNWDFFFYYY